MGVVWLRLFGFVADCLRCAWWFISLVTMAVVRYWSLGCLGFGCMVCLLCCFVGRLYVSAVVCGVAGCLWLLVGWLLFDARLWWRLTDTMFVVLGFIGFGCLVYG